MPAFMSVAALTIVSFAVRALTSPRVAAWFGLLLIVGVCRLALWLTVGMLSRRYAGG